jgi:hypothetical protein
MFSKESKAKGVESTNPGRRQIVTGKHFKNTLFHFTGSLIGKSNG